MKLTELDTPSTAAEVIEELDADSIRIARLTPEPGARPKTTTPPAVMFATGQPRQARGNPRVALVLIVAVMATTLVWGLIGSITAGSSGPSRRAAVHLTPAQQRATTAARARTAAIAKAKRDRGTDAQWGDPIPGVTPPPSSATNASLPPAVAPAP